LKVLRIKKKKIGKQQDRLARFHYDSSIGETWFKEVYHVNQMIENSRRG
jgi:hypothetical protein